MPGFRDIPADWSGSIVDGARMAEEMKAAGEVSAAITTYERVLREARVLHPEWPGFVCGRLAMLYRHVARYGDEVALLGDYGASQTTDAARVRYEARLSKARAIAEQKAPRDSGALASIRAIRSAQRSAPGGRRTQATQRAVSM